MLLALPPVPQLVLQQVPPSQERTVAPRRMGTHGMVLFGAGPRLYLSHIPMFHRPHDVQLLLAVSLEPQEAGAVPTDFSQGTYTVEPERFDLDALASGKLQRFRATVYQGNFEGGGTPVAREVTVKVEAVRYQRVLSDPAPALGAPRYLVLGEGTEVYLVHVLSHAPDFDQVLRVKLERPLPRRDGPPPVLRFEGRENRMERRLQPGERLRARDEAGAPVGLEVQRELSFLKGPDFTP